jgi:hypothetical protein
MYDLPKSKEPCRCVYCERHRRTERIQRGLESRGFKRVAEYIKGMENSLTEVEEALAMETTDIPTKE